MTRFQCALLQSLVVLLLVTVVMGAFNTPSPPLDEIYRRYFWNIPDGDYCTATANVHLSQGKLGRQRVLAGCHPADVIQDNMLFPITLAEVNNIISSSVTGSNIDYTISAKMLQNLLPAAAVADGLALVIDTGSGGLVPYSWCWNTLLRLQSLTGHVPIRAFIIRNDTLNDVGMGLSSPLSSLSPYAQPANWSIISPSWYPTIKVPAEGSEWTGLDITIVLPPNTIDWTRLLNEARYNRNKAGPGYLSPQFALETLYPMYLFSYQQPDSEIASDDLGGVLPDSCLTQSIPNCLPIGGESVWGTTRRSQPSLLDEPNVYVPPQRNILIVASASTTAPLHQHVPGAGTTGSTIATTLLLAQTLQPLINTYLRSTVTASSDGGDHLVWQPSQIVFMLTTADDYGLSGSGRFVRDLSQGVQFCTQLPQATDQVSCLIPFLSTSNFTSLGLGNFSHIIHIDQTGLSNTGQLFVHVDQTSTPTAATATPPTFNFATSTSQQYLLTAMQRAGFVLSAQAQLPPGPLFAFYPSVAAKNANLGPSPTNSASAWVSKWSASTNQTTLSVISGYDGVFVNTEYQSSRDLPQAGSAALVRLAAEQLANVLGALLWDEYQEFLRTKFPSTFTHVTSTLDETLTRADFTFSVNITSATDLWTCFAVDWGCPFLLNTLMINGVAPGSTPNYYPSVFQFESQATVPQQLIFFFLNDVLRLPNENASSCTSCPRTYTCVKNQCIQQHAFYHHAVAPGLNFVRDGNIYFRQSPQATAVDPSTQPALIWGLDPRVLTQVWVESFWNDLGTRGTMTASAAATWWAFFVGLVTCVAAIPVVCLTRKLLQH